MVLCVFVKDLCAMIGDHQLSAIRKKIDQLDSQIIPLLKKRLDLACQVMKFKKDAFDKEREEAILQKISSIHIRNIYRSILSNSQRKQKESR